MSCDSAAEERDSAQQQCLVLMLKVDELESELTAARAENKALREAAEEVVAVNTKYGSSHNLKYAIAMLDAAVKKGGG